jgi:acyl-CoA synthetase (AMP-forming)/AMP-acid ligase II
MVMRSGVGRLVEPLTGRTWEPLQTRDRVGARLADFAKVGLAPGDRVFLHYGNTLEFFVDLLAIWQMGACAVPVDSRLTLFEITQLASSARPRFAIWDEEPAGDVTRSLEELGVRSLGQPGQNDVARVRVPVTSQPRLDDEALILFTSGTTGEPKGVVHTHRSLRARWISLESVLGLDSFSRTLCLLPTHFGHGLICNCLFPWLYGQDLYVLPPFRANLLTQLGELIDTHKITFLSSVPTVWRLAIKTARPPRAATLSRIFCGSAPLSASLWRSVREWAGTRHVVNAYGITETGSWLAGTTVPFDEPEDGLVGKAWGGTLRILRTRDTSVPPAWAEDCSPGENGHVWINTPALMKGYLDRDDLTSQVVSQGWFSTGDIGTLDDRGFLYLRGREREDINKGGMKVYPGDVDAVIERFPATLDVCTFAIDDTLLGEDIGVAVVLETADDATLIALHRWSAQHLAAHQLPRKWYVVEEIPRTSRGKANRANVASHCETRQAVAYGKLLQRQATSAT